MIKRFGLILALMIAAVPAATFAAAKKPAPPKTASFSVCPSYKVNVAAHKYTTIQDAADAAVKLGASKVSITLCHGTYDQDFDVTSNASFSFKGTGVVIAGSGTVPDVFHLIGAGSLTFARGVDFAANASASDVAMTAIHMENPGGGRGTLTFARNNVSGFAQAIVLANADMKLNYSTISGNNGGDGTSTISVQGASCGKGNANVTLFQTGISKNTAGTTLALTNATVKLNNSTFDTNTGTNGIVSGTCHRISMNASAFFMNNAGMRPLFSGDADSTLSIRISSVFRNSDAGGDDFAQGYPSVSISESNASQNTKTVE